MLELVTLALLTAVLTFLVYQVIKLIFTQKTKMKAVSETMYDIPYRSTIEEEQPLSQITPEVPADEREQQVPESKPAELREPVKQAETAPEIPGQTEEQYNAPEPLQERVSTSVEESPNAKDPFEQAHNVALFGSNLRHPEALMTTGNKQVSMSREVEAGLANEVVRPSNVDELPFSAEMAQNGGQFMNGVFAFDTSDEGGGFSAY